MSKHVYTQEKVDRFKKYWPSIKREVPRGAFPNRKEYQKELTYQRYLLWLRVDRELGYFVRKSPQSA